MTLGIILIGAALHIPVIRGQPRAILRHTGIRRLLRLFHVGDQLSTFHAVTRLNVNTRNFPGSRMGHVRHTCRIQQQPLPLRFFRKGTENGPQDNGKAEDRHRSQPHPAHRAGDTDHGVQFIRGTELLQGFGIENVIVRHFAPPPCTFTVARVPLRRPSVPEVTTVSPSVRPSRISI